MTGKKTYIIAALTFGASLAQLVLEYMQTEGAISWEAIMGMLFSAGMATLRQGVRTETTNAVNRMLPPAPYAPPTDIAPPLSPDQRDDLRALLERVQERL